MNVENRIIGENRDSTNVSMDSGRCRNTHSVQIVHMCGKDVIGFFLHNNSIRSANELEHKINTFVRSVFRLQSRHFFSNFFFTHMLVRRQPSNIVKYFFYLNYVLFEETRLSGAESYKKYQMNEAIQLDVPER